MGNKFRQMAGLNGSGAFKMAPRITQDTYGFRQKAEILPNARRMAEIEAEVAAMKERGENVEGVSFTLDEADKDLVIWNEVLVMRPSPLAPDPSQVPTIGVKMEEFRRYPLSEIHARIAGPQKSEGST